MSYFNFFTHPEFTRFTSGELGPSLYKERGEATLRWFGVSEEKYGNKYILLLSFLLCEYFDGAILKLH
jgi:hypothetical protein